MLFSKWREGGPVKAAQQLVCQLLTCTAKSANEKGPLHLFALVSHPEGGQRVCLSIGFMAEGQNMCAGIVMHSLCTL